MVCIFSCIPVLGTSYLELELIRPQNGSVRFYKGLIKDSFFFLFSFVTDGALATEVSLQTCRARMANGIGRRLVVWCAFFFVTASFLREG